MSELAVPRGYKQTEVGVIPNDWEVFPLQERAKRITDGEHLTPRRTSSGFYLLSARNIHNGRIDLSEVDYVGDDEYRRIRQRCNPEAGDVLISCSGTVGRVAIVPDGFECVMVRSVALVKPDATLLSGRFAQYFLQSAVGQRQIFTSLNQGAQANLFLNHIQEIPVPLPPTKAEQEAIADALSDADALIESLEQLLVKKRQLKQGAMQELLTGKRRLPGFEVKRGCKPTEVGMIPEDWAVRPLKVIAEIRSGIAKNSNTTVSNPILVHYLRVANVQDGFLDLSEMSQIQVSRTDTKRYRVLPGDVLMNEGGDLDKLGRGAMWRGEYSPCIHQNHVFVVRCGSTLSPEYLNAWTGSEPARRYFMLAGKQTTNLASINKTALGLLPVAHPQTKAEQEAIARVFSDMDAERVAIEAKLAKARQIKQGMMQELLTGRIRLV